MSAAASNVRRARKPRPQNPELPKNRRTPKPVAKRSLAERSAQLRARMRVRLPGLRKLGSGLLRAGLALVVMACAFAATRLVESYLRSSPSFAIQRIDIQGAQQVSRSSLLSAAGLAVGQNVFAVGPEEVRSRLVQLPWIEWAQVRRRLPGRFSISLRERRAVALLSGAQLQLVSDEGIAFKPLEAGDPYDLPLITGLESSAQDDRASSTALMSAVALLHDYQDAGLSRREVMSEIHVEADGGLAMYVGADAMYVRLGKPPFRQKLERLRELMLQLAKQKERAAYVYLDNQRRAERVTARLR